MGEDSERDAAEALAQVSAALAESLDPAVVVSRVAASVRRLLRCQGATVYRLEEATGTLVLEGVDGLGPEWPIGLRWPTAVGITGVGLRAGHPVASDDIMNDPAIVLDGDARARMEAVSARAMMSAPLLSRGRIIGAITVGDGLGRRFTERELRTMKMFEPPRNHGASSASIDRFIHMCEAFLRLLGTTRTTDLNAMPSALFRLERERQLQRTERRRTRTSISAEQHHQQPGSTREQ